MNRLTFKNSNVSKESRSILKLGPILTFDAFKAEQLRFTIGTGFTYNYHKSSIALSDNAGDAEELMYKGFSLAPFTSTIIQIQNILPMTDFILGADINIFLPHTQQTSDEITVPALWGSTSPSELHYGLKTQVSYFLGFQVRI